MSSNPIIYANLFTVATSFLLENTKIDEKRPGIAKMKHKFLVIAAQWPASFEYLRFECHCGRFRGKSKETFEDRGRIISKKHM